MICTKKEKNIIIFLTFLILVVLGITAWAIWFRDNSKVIIPDYPPQETDKYAESMPTDTSGTESQGDETQQSSENKVTLNYQNVVNINLTLRKASIYFANPSNSNQNLILKLLVGDEVIAESGLVSPGYQIKTLDLNNDVKANLSGTMTGKFVATFYDIESGEKAMVNSETSVTIKVVK